MVDDLQLRLQGVDVLLFLADHTLEDAAGGEVSYRGAVRDGLGQHIHRSLLGF